MKDHVWIGSRGGRLSAMLHYTRGPVKPVVLMGHGFTADKIGTNRMNLLLAQTLEARGFHVLRFDFLGSGDSDGHFETDTYVGGWLEDLGSVIRWVKHHPPLAESPIYLLNHSLGGCVSLLYRNADIPIAGRLLMSPVVDPEANFRDLIFGIDAWTRSAAGETIHHLLDKDFSIGSGFVRDLLARDYDPLAAAETYADPIYIVHGTADALVPYSGSEKLALRRNGPVLLEPVEGANHVFFDHLEKLQTLIVNQLERWQAGQ